MLRLDGGLGSFLHAFLIWNYFLLSNSRFLQNEDIFHGEKDIERWDMFPLWYVRDDWSLFGVFGLFHSILTFHTLKTFTNEVLMKLGDLHDQNARILESFAKFGNMLQKLFLINFFNQLIFFSTTKMMWRSKNLA